MSATETTVTTADAPLAPVAESGVERTIVGGAWLTRQWRQAFIAFHQAGVDGVQFSADNSVCNLHLYASREMRAIFNDTVVPTMDRLELPTGG